MTDMQFRTINYLPIKANSLKEIETVTVFRPENVSLFYKTHENKRSFDLGRFCFSRRGERKFNPASENIEYTVDPSSFKHERTRFIGDAISFLRESNGVETTIIDKAAKLTTFLVFLEENAWPNNKKAALSCYQKYVEILTHRSRLPKVAKGSIAIPGAAAYAAVARDLIGYSFGLSKKEIERKIPSIRDKGRSSGTEPASKADRQDFVYACLSIFEQFHEAILDRKPFPWRIDLSNAGISKEFLWLGNPIKRTTHLDLFFHKTGEIKSTEDFLEALHNIPNLSSEERKSINQTFKKTSERLTEYNSSEEHYKSNLYRSYDIATQCFWYCFLAATGLNHSVAVHLNNSSGNYIPQRGYTLSGLKVRAGNKTVHAEFRKPFEKFFKKFRELRSWAVSELDMEPPVWFFMFKDMGINDGVRGTTFTLPVRKIIKDSYREMPVGVTANLKSLIEKHDIPVKPVPPSMLRKGVSFDFYKISGGDASIVAQKLGNTIETVQQAYADVSEADAYPELADYYGRVIDRVKAVGQSAPGLIPVRIIEDDEPDNLPVGNCDNSTFVSPRKSSQFGEGAPDPDCARSETCLFCEFFAIHADRSGLRKILSFRELFPLIKERSGSIDRYISVFAPIEGRIEEILNHIREAYPEKNNLLEEVSEEVLEGELDDFWEHHFNFLVELGYAA